MNVYSDDIAVLHNYKAKIRSKHHFLAQESREEFGELYNVLLHVRYADYFGMTVELRSDSERYLTSTQYDIPESRETNEPTNIHFSMRHTEEIVPYEGFYGTHFDVTIIKPINDDGHFDYYGGDWNVIPRRELGSEFISGMGTFSQ